MPKLQRFSSFSCAEVATLEFRYGVIRIFEELAPEYRPDMRPDQQGPRCDGTTASLPEHEREYPLPALAALDRYVPELLAKDGEDRRLGDDARSDIHRQLAPHYRHKLDVAPVAWTRPRQA